jgi:hypothetical protein
MCTGTGTDADTDAAPLKDPPAPAPFASQSEQASSAQSPPRRETPTRSPAIRCAGAPDATHVHA